MTAGPRAGGPRVLFLVGATATGKSDAAVRLALKAGAKIVNCDSVQVYEGLRIGSGQPTEEDKRGVPHDLYDYVAPPREMTAGTYKVDFDELMKKFSPEDRVILVGGTGFYFQAVEKGMFEVPEVGDSLRDELGAAADTPEGYARLREELKTHDVASFERIHEADRYRTLRALGILRAGGRKPSELRKEMEAAVPPFPYPLLKCGYRRDGEELKARIARRTRSMIDRGLIEETKSFLDRGFEAWAPLSSVGYKETASFLRDGKSRDWLFDEICLRTGQLAKRQRTWFQRDAAIHWFGEATEEALVSLGLRFFDGERILAP